jgi:hypothetical protein
MASNGRRIGGLILILLAILAALPGILNYTDGHPHRGLVAPIVCEDLLIVGIGLIASAPRKSKT